MKKNCVWLHAAVVVVLISLEETACFLTQIHSIANKPQEFVQAVCILQNICTYFQTIKIIREYLAYF